MLKVCAELLRKWLLNGNGNGNVNSYSASS